MALKPSPSPKSIKDKTKKAKSPFSSKAVTEEDVPEGGTIECLLQGSFRCDDTTSSSVTAPPRHDPRYPLPPAVQPQPPQMPYPPQPPPPLLQWNSSHTE
ncbi:hypothetical protein CF319_g5629 [Tilletia indica]|nr:hypothetical protein CF319_g5629 [Tilletia indica]